MAVTLITHDACRAYDLPSPYPDRAVRLGAVEDQLLASGLDPLLVHAAAPEAGATALTRLHDPAYLAELAAREPVSGSVPLDGDTLLVPGILAAARHAAGAALTGVEKAVGAGASAFALTRPPGHHAHRAAAGGFCLLNHAALAAYRARELGMERVGIVDFDAHHGDGTEALVAGDGGIRLFSIYEEEGFRSPPAGTGPGGSLRLALPRGADGTALRTAVAERLLPELADFRPEVLVVSAGFDGHHEDDLSGLRLREADYAWLVATLQTTAGPWSAQRAVFVLEGGYAPAALGRSVAACLKVLLESP